MKNDSVIIISDPHACFKTFLALLSKLPKDIPIVVAGDLIDRGTDSQKMVQYCIDNNIQVCIGNHELMMSEWRDFDDLLWLQNGGLFTLLSYGAKRTENGIDMSDFDWTTFEEHRKWMKNLPYFLEFPELKNERGQHLLVTHSTAGGVWKWYKEHRNADILRDQMLWARPNRVKSIEGIYNIYGHTPREFKPTITDYYANIDTGCVYINRPNQAILSALQYPEMIVFQQKNIEDM
jgi:serine/threonine protein phosphatase 1